MNKDYLEDVGWAEGYHCFKNSDGFIEGYKTIGNSKYGVDTKGSDVIIIVTNQTTMQGFAKYVLGLNKKKRIKPQPVPKLFNDE